MLSLFCNYLFLCCLKQLLQRKDFYMKKLSISLLSSTIASQRKEKQLTQKQLSELTGINRTMISRLEKEDYLPSIQQLETLAEVLDFEPTTMFVEEKTTSAPAKHVCPSLSSGTVRLSPASRLKRSKLNGEVTNAKHPLADLTGKAKSRASPKAITPDFAFALQSSSPK
jgi:transcriptional regulator with XRE-family HTH domain